MIRFGSARIDENGKIVGGKPGDQTGREVSMQNYYMSSKGWYCLRPKSVDHATKLAKAMTLACDNDNIGYNQDQRYQVISKGINSKTPINADCSSLVRACIIYATGKDVGNFTTYSEADTLEGSGLFEKRFAVKSETDLYDGDVLVTKTKGHTVIVVSGRSRIPAKKGYAGEWPKLPTRGWFQNGDVSAEVCKLKKFLNWYGNYKLTETNKNYFDKTAAAVRDFQTKEKLAVDGEFGSKSLAKAKTIKK